MLSRGKVSIIVPIYNVERYLPECIESLIHQTYDDIEILLVDDGSTDHSGQICEEYAVKDSRIRVIHQINAGAANAKNAGLDMATGAYITFADSDDRVDHRWIEIMLTALWEHDADVVECDFAKWYTDHEETESNAQFRYGEYTAEEYLRSYLHSWTCSLFWNKLFHAKLTSGIRFRKERRCIDDEFYTYKILATAKKIVRIPQCLYYYRQRASSAVSCRKNRPQIADDALEILIERYEWITTRFPSLRNVFLQHDVEILFYICTLDHNDHTVKKFRRISRYFLWQALCWLPNRQTVINAWNAQGISKKKLLMQAQHAEQSPEGYFL